MLFTPESFVVFLREIWQLNQKLQCESDTGGTDSQSKDNKCGENREKESYQITNRLSHVKSILDLHYSNMDAAVRETREKGTPIIREMMDIHTRLEQNNVVRSNAAEHRADENDPLAGKLSSLRRQLYDNASELEKRMNASADELMRSLKEECEQRIHGFREDIQICRQDFERAYAAGNDGNGTATPPPCVQPTASEQAFLQAFPPDAYMDEYVRIYSREPVYAAYSCCKTIPDSFHICTMEYRLNDLGLCGRTMDFLRFHYPYMIRGEKICMPYSLPFGKSFNHFFCYHDRSRDSAVHDARTQGIRLLATIPPGKVRLTLIDPKSLGTSFDILNQVAGQDDQTREVIGKKTWCFEQDIEKQLREVQDHISNIIQHCLQGMYQNLCEYNRVAAQNAESYRVLILMDFPSGMTTESLDLLKKILETGPKCGVFVLVYSNEDSQQFSEADKEKRNLVEQIKKQFSRVHFTDNDSETICFTEHCFREKPIMWHPHKLPEPALLQKMFAVLRKGIAFADPGPFGIERILGGRQQKSSASNIKIPIGICGADTRQYLTLGGSDCQNALIACTDNARKSELLHTIIYTLMHRYDPDELQIYLLDFKHGDGFKVYAEYRLPSFQVLAIDSERELGCNVLHKLEEEQRWRAGLFSGECVETYEEYRKKGKKLPRIVLIMDEFQELFANSNDEIARASEKCIKQLVEKNKDLGIHMIMASQNYSSIRIQDPTIYTQIPVHIVLKCLRSDAEMLLDNGIDLVRKIAPQDSGMAIYSAISGSNSSCTYFRMAAIEPKNHREYLKRISLRYQNRVEQTNVFLTNVSNHTFHIFNQFSGYGAEKIPVPGRLYLGAPVSLHENLTIDLSGSETPNLLMVGNNSEKACAMFTFALLSLCINYKVRYGCTPEAPIAYLLNFKTTENRDFTEFLNLIAQEPLNKYICAVEKDSVEGKLKELTGNRCVGDPDEKDTYVFIFGAPQAAARNLQYTNNWGMLDPLLRNNSKKGIHTVLWHHNYQTLCLEAPNLPAYFGMKIAFDMERENNFGNARDLWSENDISQMNRNNAVYCRNLQKQRFVPYQMPTAEWLRSVVEKL